MHDFRGQSKAATPHVRPPPFFTWPCNSPLPPLSPVKKPSYVGTSLVSRLRWGKSVVFASRSLDVSNSALQPEALGTRQTGLAECGVVPLGIKPAEAEVKVSAKVLSRGGREEVRP